ncbi:MAG: hypothetical protein MRZ79_22190 [Bacteroidia bacterium]|nr:hypothetical protein [Bacteroidia bacterium]
MTNKHFLFYFLACLFFCSSCQNNASPKDGEGHTPDKKEEPEVSKTPISTSWENFELPDGFTLDSMEVFYDSLLSFRKQALPLSGNPEVDAFMKGQLEGLWRDFTKGLDYYVEDSLETSLYIFPEFVYLDEERASYLFSVSSMHQSAAHPNHGYLDINIKLPSMEEIKFEDVFAFKTTEDSAQFLDLVNSAVPDYADVRRLYPYKFNIGQDSLQFAFDSYEVGPYAIGTPRGRLALADINTYLKKPFGVQ